MIDDPDPATPAIPVLTDLIEPGDPALAFAVAVRAEAQRQLRDFLDGAGAELIRHCCREALAEQAAQSAEHVATRVADGLATAFAAQLARS